VSFNDRAELISAFTNSADDLQSRLLSASGKGRTALLDAIYLGLSEMIPLETINEPCSSSPTAEITTVGTTRKISSGWFGRRG